MLGSAFVCDTGACCIGVVMNQQMRWLAKLRQDQRVAKADIAVLVSLALPKGVKHFELIDGVYVVSPQCVRPVAEMLRGLLVEVAGARQSAEGRETKATVVYQYLTGSRFRQHMQAIVEAFSTMQEDLSAEKKVMMKQRAKREMQIERVIGSTAGLYGDLQGIVGRTLVEVAGLEVGLMETSQSLGRLESR